MDNTNLLKMLEYIDPANCDYQEWVNVGNGSQARGLFRERLGQLVEVRQPLSQR